MSNEHPGHLKARRQGRPPNAAGRDTAAELLDAALTLFAEKGYAATSVREIAEAVGVRDSAIYAHFDSKRQIYDRLVEHAGPGVLQRLSLDLERLVEEPPETALPALVSQLLGVWDEPRTRQVTSLLIREGLAGVDAALVEVRRALTDVFATWVEQDRLRNDVSTELLVWEFMSPLATARLLFLHGQASPDERRRGHELARQHVNYFVRTAATDPR